MPDASARGSQHPIEHLFAEMPLVEPYPEGVVPVPARIPGVAFFPGGAGLWGVMPGQSLPPMPTGGIMVLGHDFHSEAAFKHSLKARTEVPQPPVKRYRIPPTWLGLRRLFLELHVPLEECFFTNAYMGLRKGRAVTGRFPGASDAGYVARCRQFLLVQIEAQRPSLIITLGAWVPAFIAPLSKDLARWKTAANMAEIDAKGPLVTDVRFDELPEVCCTVAAITHPSLRGPNVGRRRYKGAEGHRAELELMYDACSAAGRPLPALAPLSVRSAIVETYAQWTALSALRSGAPIKSRAEVYTALLGINFGPLFDMSGGAVPSKVFDAWHKDAVQEIVAGEPRLSVGWAAKIINVYLKTRAYVGGEGRPGLAAAIHPPIDAGLWQGMEKRFGERSKIVSLTNCVTRIKDIVDYHIYSQIIEGCRIAARELECRLIEVEQLWEGTALKEVLDEG